MRGRPPRGCASSWSTTPISSTARGWKTSSTSSPCCSRRPWSAPRRRSARCRWSPPPPGPCSPTRRRRCRPSRAAPCTRPSPSARGSIRSGSPWWTASKPGPTATSRSRPAGWRGGCTCRACAPETAWRCSPTAAHRWPRHCSACSKPAQPSPSSIPRIPAPATPPSSRPRRRGRSCTCGGPAAAVEEWLRGTSCPRLGLPCGGPAPLLDLLAGQPPGPAPAAARPEHPAYVSFTSGSTGEPKGVVASHLPLAHFVAWHAARFQLGAGDRFSLLSGLAHDPLLRDLFTPLCLGARLAIPAPGELTDPDRLARWLRREAVTVAHLTPALAEVLTAARGILLPALRLACCGGDVLTRQLVERLRRLAPGCTAVNFYGATETPQGMGYLEVVPPERERIPVGRGIDGVQLLVLTAAGGLAGVGELGEICIRSPYLALGYLDDPALTGERFVTNPFTGAPADRLYRTGDLGRYLPDGAVDLQGRRDLQVKVRGFRVEPAEIEAVLGAAPGVREVAVVAREQAGERRLVAYVVAAGEHGPQPAELRAWARERLPQPLVPSAFVPLPRLPLTPNGKLDRRALPPPAADAELAGRYQAPATDLELEIAAVWQEVLGVERVGVHDNFFDLGGHSLLLVRLHSRLQEALGADLSLIELFSHPNVLRQAERIRELRGGAAVAAPAPARRSLGPDRIAVVGMAGRFPGAQNVAALWRNLRDGVESVRFFSDEELRASGVAPGLLENPRYVRAYAEVAGDDLFDAGFFDLPPRQAELTDPQHRSEEHTSE